MALENEGDLALFNTITAGDILSENGEPRMEQGLGTAVLISLFSGQKDKFWGDKLSNDPSENYGGDFEVLADELDATVENALKLEEAILSDLQWMKDEEIADKIEVTSSIENGDNIFFVLVITRPSEESEEFKFSNNWTGQFLNPSNEGIE